MQTGFSPRVCVRRPRLSSWESLMFSHRKRAFEKTDMFRLRGKVILQLPALCVPCIYLVVSKIPPMPTATQCHTSVKAKEPMASAVTACVLDWAGLEPWRFEL